MTGQTRKHDDRGPDRAARGRTAGIAILAGLPGLALTALAAATSTALTLKADLALSVLDMIALVVAWRLAGSPVPGGRAETIACAFVALTMTVSMAVVAAVAIWRIAAGGMAPQGPGAPLGMALNLAYAAVNGWILIHWRRRHRAAPSPLSRSQVCLFADKLCSNLLIGGSIAAAMALDGHALALHLDPVAGLLVAAASARWALPVIKDARGALRSGRGAAGALP